jgi:hypothetical protein
MCEPALVLLALSRHPLFGGFEDPCMNPRRHFAPVPRACLAFALAGCMGGQTGGEFSNEDPVPPPGVPTGEGSTECKEPALKLSLSEVSPAGFSGEDVLALTLGAHRAPLHWNTEPSIATFGPEQGESSVEVVIEYRGGEVRFYKTKAPAGSGAGVDSGAAVTCQTDHLEVDVFARLTTAGGALAEEFSATLTATTPGHAQLSRDLLLTGLSGSFFLSLPPSFSASQLKVNASFEAERFSGSLGSTVEQQVGDPKSAGSSVGAMFVPFAAWP